MPTRTAERTVRLTGHLRYVLTKEMGWVDRYDPDFIMGTLMAWLAENNCALTGEGVRARRP